MIRVGENIKDARAGKGRDLTQKTRGPSTDFRGRGIGRASETEDSGLYRSAFTHALTEKLLKPIEWSHGDDPSCDRTS